MASIVYGYRGINGVAEAGYGSFGDLGDDAPPPQVDRQAFIDAVVNNYVPLDLVESISAKVAANEAELHAFFGSLDIIRQTGENPPDLALWNRTYLASYAKHNEHKFWLMLIPAFRRQLQARGCKPPSLSVLTASNATVAQFVRDQLAPETVAALLADGTYLAGYDGARGYGAYGVVEIPLATAAVVIVGLIAAMWTLHEVLVSARTAANDWVLARQQRLVDQGKAPPDSVAALAAKLPSPNSGSPLGFMTIGLIGAAAVVFGPMILNFLKGRSAK